jgi:ABC-type antimicrobial peptide transport system permease subunit
MFIIYLLLLLLVAGLVGAVIGSIIGILVAHMIYSDKEEPLLTVGEEEDYNDKDPKPPNKTE